MTKVFDMTVGRSKITGLFLGLCLTSTAPILWAREGVEVGKASKFSKMIPAE
jgi:hypothetical protein